MKSKITIVCLLLSTLLCINHSFGKADPKPSDRLITNMWNAQWVCDPDSPAYEFGVYHFRKNFSLQEKPSEFIINISADNRYRLFVNGTPVCWGPARGDLRNWYYETIDIAQYLQKGENTLAVLVWNFGEYIPVPQITRRTGLIVQGNSEKEDIVNTPTNWKSIENEAYTPSSAQNITFYLGTQDNVDAAKYPWGWEQPEYDDNSWNNVKAITIGKPYGSFRHGGESDWVLTPRDIPFMEETKQRIPSVRRFSGIDDVSLFTGGNAPLTIPANTKCSILLDQIHLTTAFPELLISGGKNSLIKITYAEALFNKEGKANRNEIEGREIQGYYDTFRPDGAQHRLFRTLWFKTYRYIQLDIETAEQPLTIEDMYGIYTGYPFQERGSFSSDDKSLASIWETGWRTARLCAHETYFDCPYYEQLQYVGDTRIQGLISLYVSGDDRLLRKAIHMYDQSRSPEGITASRYPSSLDQRIPPFSLYWVDMVHDYWMHRNDEQFVKSYLPGIEDVLNWFIQKIDPTTGMLQGNLPHWNFSDWVPAWPSGIAPEGENAGSALLTLQLADALRNSSELMSHFGHQYKADEYDKLYKSLIKNTYDKCWDNEQGLLKDYIGSSTFSQHVNIMGILTDAIPEQQQQAVFEKLDSDTSLSQATFYYRFYLFRALKKVGLADRYVDMLQPWYNMIEMGLTTFAENPEPTRSDCHAWSSSPNYDLLATVCGVEPDAYGFTKVKIEPHMGRLTEIQGVVPHPNGDITVTLTRNGDKIKGNVTLPTALDGRFVWKGKEIKLKPGTNNINL